MKVVQCCLAGSANVLRWHACSIAIPFFVVLDEPNANLDAEGESALASAIHNLREQGSTVIIMAHRARTIATANLVLVLENGRQVAFDDKEKVLVPKIARASSETARSDNVHAIPQPA